MQAMGGLSGRQIAGYELGAPLGEDGFGPTYEAFHVNLGRTFALRVLSDQFTFANGFEEGFWRVTRVLSTLEHGNVLTLDDYGINGPYAYLVTPFVEGLTLDAWLRQRPGKPVGPAQVMRLFGQMLAGLGYAHQAGITHLGLTPKHILIQPNGHLLIANFGLPYLAEQLWIAWNGSRSFGDPLYLAPEQFPGRTPSGAAADLYALGIILYRLLAGVLPFEGMPQSLLSAKFVGPPPLREKHPDLPEALDRLVRRALAPAPEDRWASVAEFGGAFYQALGQAGYLSSMGWPSGAAGGPALPARNASVPLLSAPDASAPAGGVAGSLSVGAAGPAAPERGEPARSRSTLQPPSPDSRSRADALPPALKGEPAAMVAWSSAGKGRAVPPPLPAWRPERPPEPVYQRDFASRLLAAMLRLLLLLVTLGVLGFASFYGYMSWEQLQHRQQPMPAPAVTPTPGHSPTPQHRIT
jgi:serine/threonine protein kinase